MTPAELNQQAYARARFRQVGHEWREDPYGIYGYSARPAGLNLVCGCSFEPGREREQIDQILRQFQRWEAPANWFFGPSSTPADLSKILRKERRCMGPRFLPGMELELGNWTAPQLRPEITAGLISNWEAVRAEGHPTALWYPRASREDYVTLIQELNASEEVYCFGAYADGWLAGACILFVHEEIAGIYDVVTKEAFRNRGVASACLTAAHEHAREIGARLAILHSHKKAAGLYERLGYREAGMFTSMYYSRVRCRADALENGYALR